MDSIVQDLPTEIYGEGNDVLVFAHGFGGSREDWKLYVDYFKSKATIVTFDHLGSSKINIPDSLIDLSFSDPDFHTKRLISVLKKIDPKKNVCLIAHSYSGLLGVTACLEMPSLIDKLVLIGCSPRYLNDGDYNGGITMEGVNLIFQNISENFIDWVDDFKNAVFEEGETNRDSFQASILSMGPKRALAIAKAIFMSDYRPLLSKLDTPTLVIHSNADPIVNNEAAQFMCSEIKNVTCQTIQSSSHFPHVRHFDLVSSYIENFTFQN